MNEKLHYRYGQSDYSVCGVSTHDDPNMKFTSDMNGVTCERCRQKMAEYKEVSDGYEGFKPDKN